MKEYCKVHIDKKTAAQWQINCSIRNIFIGECPVSNHVIIMSARQILLEYAKAQKTPLIHDPLSHITEQNLRRELEDFWKERYNFLKHANFDHDEEADITNVEVANECETLFNITRYRELFSEITMHMGVYYYYLLHRFPDIFNAEAFSVADNMKHQLGEQISKHAGKPRRKLCTLFSEAIQNIPPMQKEFSVVQDISYSEPQFVAKKEAAPYYRRKKAM